MIPKIIHDRYFPVPEDVKETISQLYREKKLDPAGNEFEQFCTDIQEKMVRIEHNSLRIYKLVSEIDSKGEITTPTNIPPLTDKEVELYESIIAGDKDQEHIYDSICRPLANLMEKELIDKTLGGIFRPGFKEMFE